MTRRAVSTPARSSSVFDEALVGTWAVTSPGEKLEGVESVETESGPLPSPTGPLRAFIAAQPKDASFFAEP